MPEAECPKCVSFTECEHKELAKGYRFRIKCDGCEHFDEKIREPNKEGEYQCPFCGQIEIITQKKS